MDDASPAAAADNDQNARSFRVVLEDIGARIGSAFMHPTGAVNNDAVPIANEPVDPPVVPTVDTEPDVIYVASSSSPRPHSTLQRTPNSRSGLRIVLINDVILIPSTQEGSTESSGEIAPTRKRKR